MTRVIPYLLSPFPLIYISAKHFVTLCRREAE